MSAGAAPRLTRAIAEATQPYGPLDASHGLHALEEYLVDQHGVNLVFQGIVERACAEPVSLGVIEKCVALLKRGLPRYSCSAETLMEVDHFCQSFQLRLSSSSQGTSRSLQYLQVLARQQGPGRAAAAHRVNVPTPSHARIASDPIPALAQQLADANGSISMQPVSRAMSTPMLDMPQTTRTYSKTTASGSASSLPSPMGVLSEAGPPSSMDMIEESMQKAGQMHSNMLDCRWASAAQETPSSRAKERLWQEFLPSLGVTYHAGGASEQVPDDLIKSQAALREQVKIILDVQAAKALQVTYGDEMDASGRLRIQQQQQHRPGMLFQHQPYIDQEPLHLNQREIGAVVDAVCGTAGSASAWGEIAFNEWEDGLARGGAALASHPGTICAGILIKLLLDLWLHNPASLSFPLALVMLHRALASSHAAVRARSFDIIYNMAVHAELLTNSEAVNIAEQIEGGAWADANDREEAGSYSNRPSASHSDRLPSEKAETGAAHYRAIFQWLRLLLFELLSLITQRKEADEEVWQAALGCLLHLTFVQGQPIRPLLAEFPLQTLPELLQRCSQHQWSPQIRTHLIRIIVNLLYHAAQAEEMDIPDNESGLGSIHESIASMTTEETPRLPDRLVMSRLDSFGGINRVAAEFQAATCLEERCNWFCIMLDYVSATQGSESSSVQQACALLASEPVIHSLCTAFNVGQAGFAPRIAHAICASRGDMDTETHAPTDMGLQSSLVRVLEQLGLLSTSRSQGVLPSALQPALDYTLACIDEDSEEQDEIDLDSASGSMRGRDNISGLHGQGPADDVWSCMCDLFCSDDSWAGRLGADWLYLLILTAAQHQLQLSPDIALQQDVALLPHPPDALSSIPMGISGQSRLARALETVLQHGSAKANTASRFLQVVQQLLLCIKLQCMLSSNFKGGSVTNPWRYHADCAATLVLNTMFVAVEWLLCTQAILRQQAYMQTAELLLSFLSIPHSASMLHGHDPDTSRKAANPETTANALRQQHVDRALSGTSATSSHTNAFLEGAMAVPQHLLQKVSPVMLSRLFRGLAPAVIADLPQIHDVRLAVLLLLLGRCHGDDAALAHAGGEGMIVDILADADARLQHHAASFLQARVLRQRPEEWRRALQHLLPQALQQSDDKLLHTPYLQLVAMLDMQLLSFTP